MIELARYTGTGDITAAIDGAECFVPNDPANRDRQRLAKWEAAGNVIEPYAPAAPTPNQLKAYAAARRYEIEQGGTNVADFLVSTDDRSQIKLTAARVKAEADSSFATDWKGGDGVFRNVSAAEIRAISDAVLDFVEGLFAKEAGIVAAITAGTITAAEQIDAAFAAP
jgi:hypothetical protein